VAVATASTIFQFPAGFRSEHTACIRLLPAAARALGKGHVGHVSTSGFLKSLMLFQSKITVTGISLSDSCLTHCF